MLYNPITSLADEHYLGFFIDSATLNTAHPAAGDGDFAIVGATDTVWVWDATTTAWVDSGSSATGNVVGPVSATDNAVARYDSTTGKIIQNSTVTVDDDGIIGASGVDLVDDTSAGFSFEKTGANAGVFQIYNDGFANVVGPGSSPSRRFAFYDQMGAGAGTEALPPFTNFNDTDTGMYFPANNEIGFSVGGTEAVHITSLGITASSIELGDASDCTLSRSAAGKLAVEGVNVGTEGILVSSISADYTIVQADNGKKLYHPSADTTARNWTLSSGLSSDFTCTVINDTSAGTLTITAGSDALVYMPTGATGNRTLAANGMCTITNMTTTRKAITGVGLT